MPLRSPLLAACIAGLVFGAAGLAAEKAAGPSDFFVYFGTYTGPKSKGIYRARFDATTGKLSTAELAVAAPDPSFLAVPARGGFLYAIDEKSDPAKTPGRGVSAFALDRRTGALRLLNQQEVGGRGPAHVTLDATGRCVLVANYGAGSIASLPVAADGRLGPAASTIKHTGSGANPGRQKEPHAHMMLVSPDNRFALCADLGIDKVMIYQLDPAKATLTANSPAFAAVPPGSGPRHLVFHPNGRFVYVINEILCTMTVFRYEAANAAMTELQTVSTLRAGETVQKGQSTAEVLIHPTGRFLYGSNRGHDTIVVYAVDPRSGKITLVQHEPTQGKTPRHFALDPTGKWLLAENQQSDSVVVFAIDTATGKLTPTGQTVEVPAPVCAVFVPVGR
jgi:6-phosphogluconolactonase